MRRVRYWSPDARRWAGWCVATDDSRSARAAEEMSGRLADLRWPADPRRQRCGCRPSVDQRDRPDVPATGARCLHAGPSRRGRSGGAHCVRGGGPTTRSGTGCGRHGRPWGSGRRNHCLRRGATGGSHRPRIRGRSALAEIVLGSVARNVLAGSEASVLVVRTPAGAVR